MSSACLDRMKLKWKKTLSPYGRNTPLIKSDKFFIAVFALMALWIFVPSARRAQGTMLSCIRVRPYYLLLVEYVMKFLATCNLS